MPDEKTSKDRGADASSKIPSAERLGRLRGVTPLTLILVIVFILSAVTLIGVMSLPVLRDYFEGETAFWILRIGLLVLIASIIIYLVLRERSNFRYAEKLLDQMTETNTRLTLLLQAERDFGSALELEDALDHTLKYASWVTGADVGAACLWERGEDSLKPAMAIGVDEAKMPRRWIAVGEGLVGKAAAERSMVTIDDAASIAVEDNVFAGVATPASQVIVPLEAGDRLVGVFVLGTTASHEYTFEEKNMLTGLAELAGLTMKNAELYRIARKSLNAVARQREVTGLVLDEMVAGVVTVDSAAK